LRRRSTLPRRRLPGLAAELVRLKVDVVMAAIIDPLASGLVTSLARPGGNVTGQSMMSPDLAEKQLELLKEIVPKATRMARPRPWACGFKSWERETPARSIAPSRR